MDALVTVIVPIYKVEPYLKKCVSSIMQQTYDNLEIINDSNIDKDNITFRIPLNNEYTLRDNNINGILNLLEKKKNKMHLCIFL